MITLQRSQHVGSAEAVVRQRLHLGFLDGVRAVAALSVVFYHAYLAVYVGKGPIGLTVWPYAVVLYGHYAVPVFIVVSGFCLILPVVRGDGTLRGGSIVFLRRRARRILPPYLCAMILVVALHWLVGRNIPSRGDILTHVLLIHNLFPAYIRSKSVNPSFWSIAVESQFYLLFPLLVWLWRVWGAYRATLVTVVLAGMGYALCYGTAIEGTSLQLLALFIIGCLGGTMGFATNAAWHRQRERLWHGTLALTITGVALAMGVLLGPAPNRWYTEGGLELLIGGAAACILVHAACAPTGRVHQLLALRPLQKIGLFSYSLYLLHQPLLNVVLRPIRKCHLNNNANFALLLVCGIPACLVMSYLFYLAFERPFTSAQQGERANA